MFTGIIQKLGTVSQIELAGESTRIRIATGFADLESGESVAVNGVCLTVTDFDALGNAQFFVSPETLAKSSLGSLKTASLVNLERAVTLSTRLSGHLVQGHVDGMGKLLEVQERAESFQVRFEIPARLARYCVEKGSIAINGVSLTINFLERASAHATVVGITLIPHTWTHTQFSKIQAGDAVNIEVDVLAKYVESLSKPYSETEKHV
jgi:riboflavin synthase